MALIMANPTERDLIRMRRDAQIDWNTMMRSAEKTGREKGRTEGRIEGKKEIARGMKAEGMSDALIVKYTGLTKEEVEAL